MTDMQQRVKMLLLSYDGLELMERYIYIYIYIYFFCESIFIKIMEQFYWSFVFRLYYLFSYSEI